MDWFQSKTGQIIALVSIVGTLAGFGYTGATYVNRLENLEAKIGGVDEAEDEMKITLTKKVSPKQGRVVLFDGIHWHTAQQSNHNIRCIVNYDLRDLSRVTQGVRI